MRPQCNSLTVMAPGSARCMTAPHDRTRHRPGLRRRCNTARTTTESSVSRKYTAYGKAWSNARRINPDALTNSIADIYLADALSPIDASPNTALPPPTPVKLSDDLGRRTRTRSCVAAVRRETTQPGRGLLTSVLGATGAALQSGPRNWQWSPQVPPVLSVSPGAPDTQRGRRECDLPSGRRP
jgi:hypothetical protein